MKRLLVLGLNLFLLSCLASTPDSEQKTSEVKPSVMVGTIQRDTTINTSSKQTEGGNACPPGIDCKASRRKLMTDVVDYVSGIAQTISSSESRMVEATNRFMASIYQSCDVLQEKQDTLTYDHANLSRKPPHCKTPIKPPRYRLGSKTDINTEGKIESTYISSDRRYNTYDCSGLITAVMRAAGLKTYPSEEDTSPIDHTPDHGTAGLQTLGKPHDCFNNVEFTPEERLRAGDIVSWRIGQSRHAVIISKLGDDPFGIKSLDKTKCNVQNIDYTKFNFEVTHSLGRPAIGPVQHNVQAMFAVVGTSVRTRFMLMAIEACKAYHKDVTTRASSNRQFKILRHAGDTQPNCIASIIPVKGEECYHHCKGDVE